LYAKEGAKVIVADLNFEGAQAIAEDIMNNDGKAKAIQVNVAKLEDIENMIDTTVKEYGTLDILVNNASIMDGFEPVSEVNEDKWDLIFDFNTKAVMRDIRKAIPIILENEKGVIINIASTGGLNGAHSGAAYVASKHTVVGITKNTGFMYANKGIRCNVIAPGGVATNIASSIKNINEFGISRTKMVQDVIPRVGNSEEIAHVALFLASDESSFVNGTVIVADAGRTAAL
jgi:NAD(P)-dependent dehydrogenase (short-subunit alcohol dehydrogenase family)